MTDRGKQTAGRPTAIVPVAPLDRALAGLAGFLDDHEREKLAVALLRDVLHMLKRVAGLAGIRVLTRDPEASEIATWEGAGVLVEAPETSLNVALARASLALTSEGVPAMLVVPADLPAADPAEITNLIERHGGAHRERDTFVEAASIVPDRHRVSTNLLLVSPATALPFRFGPDSFSAHRQQAAKRIIHGRPLPLDVALLPSIGLDIDQPDDLSAFLKTGSKGETAIALSEMDIAARLNRQATSRTK
ncbi:MAG: 2-phospho-L-lactate guanylyltransferase [Magnetovibrionaceae bacterium]